MPAQLWRRRRGRQISVFALKRRDGSHPGRSAAQDLALRQGILAVGRSAVHFPPARSDAQGRNTCAATWKALPRFPTISGDSLWTRLCYKDDSDSDRAKSEGASGQPALVRCCEEEKPLPGSWQRNARGLFCNDTLPPDWRISPANHNRSHSRLTPIRRFHISEAGIVLNSDAEFFGKSALPVMLNMIAAILITHAF